MKKIRLALIAGGIILLAAVAVFAVILFLPQKKLTGNITFTFDDITLVEVIEDEASYGASKPATRMQGMAASPGYLYVAKHFNDQNAIIVQYNPKNDKQKTMTYYPDLTTTDQATLDSVFHCNDMTIYTDTDNKQYMLTASTYTPDSTVSAPCITRLQLDEKEGSLRLTGFFNLKKAGSDGYFGAGSVRHIASTETYHYFVVKNSNSFYSCKIPVGAGGGTLENPQDILCTRLFTADTRNALFVDENGETYTLPNLETWTHQGFFYNPEEDMIYIQLYNQYNAPTNRFDNAIVTFLTEGRLTVEAMDAVTSHSDVIIHPTNLSFHLKNKTNKFFEVESCVFLKDQGRFGDHHLYFNTNGTPVTDLEGIWKVDYKSASAEVSSIVDDSSLVYTVEYHYNKGDIPESQWKQNPENNNYNMLVDTIHIDGIPTNLRPNRYAIESMTFPGWQLYRNSDGKWLYADDNWYTEDSAPAGIDKKILKDGSTVDHLTTVNGDVITAYVYRK